MEEVLTTPYGSRVVNSFFTAGLFMDQTMPVTTTIDLDVYSLKYPTVYAPTASDEFSISTGFTYGSIKS